VSGEDDGGRVFFARARRNLADTEQTILLSVGVDIGSATSHLVFSRIRMEQRDGRYVVAERDVLFESDILFTPYADADTIDAAALGRFIAQQYRDAGLTPEQIDTGALILTGIAVAQRNARAIGELFAVETGKFVSVSAGDRLETAMAAHGSGATLNSGLTGANVMNVDIGGGTTKIAVCVGGKIADLTAADIGARLVALDDNGRVDRVVPAAARFAAELGIALVPGAPPPAGALEAVAGRMAERIMQLIALDPVSPETEAVLRLPPIRWRGRIDAITFSGGVSELIYGYDDRQFGDLGGHLARAVRARVVAAWLRVMEPVESIRATVVGASQYTIQLSGNTIFVEPEDALPLRNVPVIAPDFDLAPDDLDPDAIRDAVAQALLRLDLAAGEKPVAACFDWLGSASYPRIHAFLSGVVQGLAPVLGHGHPLVLVCRGDIGRVFGRHASGTLGIAAPVVSIDGIALEEFDFIDIGAVLPGSGAVPVVIKSLLFPSGGA